MNKKKSSKTINFDLDDTHFEVEDKTNGEVTEQDIKNAIEKENPQIWVNNTDGTHYIMDFSCNINGKKYNIGSTNIKGDYSLMQLWIERSPWDKKQSGIVPTKEIILDDGRKFTVRYNPNEKSITTILDENGREIGVDTGTRLQLLRKLFHKGEPTIVESKKKNAGYSNNPNYFGDWFGKGQIDYSKIINPEDDGKIWMLKIWGGSGYILDVYLVKANDYEEAIDITFKWSYENEGKNKVIKDYEYLSKFCKEDYESEYFYGKGEGKPSDKMSYEDFETRWFEDFVSDSYNELFAYSENFFIDELPEIYTNKKQSSKKVTAENMTIDDIEEEDNKDEVQEEIDKINDTPVEELLVEETPIQYFDNAVQEDKVDTINEVVSKCIDKFSEKFANFSKYTVKILSYNTKVLGDYAPNKEEMVEDKEINANAILQIILAINNNADDKTIKKALAVFSITNGKLHWSGTIRGENDQIVAFTEEGIDNLFEVEEVKEDELEDII